MKVKAISIVEAQNPDKVWVPLLAFDEKSEAENWCKDAPINAKKRVREVPKATYREQE
jgi:hypothetical protein